MTTEAVTPIRPLLEVLAEHVAEIRAAREIPAPGTVVAFREGTPQHPANAGLRYVVTSEPHPSIDQRPAVWLELLEDIHLPPSQRRARSAYVAAIEPVEVDQIDQLLATVSAHIPAAKLIRNAPQLAHATKPRRARAACVIGIRGDRFELSSLDGKGYIVEHFTTTDAAAAVAFVMGSLR